MNESSLGEQHQELPEVELLAALRPNNPMGGEPKHTYKNLADKARGYEQTLARREREFWGTSEGSIEQQVQGLRLAKAYMLLTALESNIVRSPEAQALWATRFTEASSEIYGAPETGHIHNLLAQDMELLEKACKIPEAAEEANQLKALYEQYGFDHLEVDAEWQEHFEMQREIAKGLVGPIVQEKFGAIFAEIDKSGIDWFSPEQAIAKVDDVFEGWRREDPVKWAGWHGELKETAGADTSYSRKAISLNNTEMRKAERLKGTITHEAHHAEQDTNCQGKSLPGGLDWKEGIAVLAAETVNGGNNSSRDHYLNIGLAMGIGIEKAMSRPDLSRMVKLRNVLRKKIENPGVVINDQHENEQAWRTVDRILRGTPSDTLQTTGVYTKDISYYQGYLKVIDYFNSEFANGKSAEQIYDFIMSWVFDPTNPSQADFVRKSS